MTATVSSLHPYHPWAIDHSREASADHPRHYRAAILCRFRVGRDGAPQWVASLKRGQNERAQTATLSAAWACHGVPCPPPDPLMAAKATAT